jgi:hypothetical protein
MQMEPYHETDRMPLLPHETPQRNGHCPRR